jgi:hypothetical protein
MKKIVEQAKRHDYIDWDLHDICLIDLWNSELQFEFGIYLDLKPWLSVVHFVRSSLVVLLLNGFLMRKPVY